MAAARPPELPRQDTDGSLRFAWCCRSHHHHSPFIKTDKCFLASQVPDSRAGGAQLLIKRGRHDVSLKWPCFAQWITIDRQTEKQRSQAPRSIGEGAAAAGIEAGAPSPMAKLRRTLVEAKSSIFFKWKAQIRSCRLRQSPKPCKLH